MSLRKKLYSYFSGLLLVPVLMLGVFGVIVVATGLRSINGEGLQALAVNTGQLLDHHVAGRRLDVERQAGLLKPYLSMDGNALSDARQELDARLSDWVSAGPDYTGALLLDKDGSVVAYAGISGAAAEEMQTELSTQWPAGPAGRTYVRCVPAGGSAMTDTGPDCSLLIGIRIEDAEGGECGSLLLSTGMDFFLKAGREYQYNKTGALYLSDSQGNILFCSQNPDVTGMTVANDVKLLGLKRATGAAPEQGIIRYNSDGANVTAGYYYLREAGLLLVMSQENSEIYSPVFYYIGAVVLAIALSVPVLFRMLRRPVARLTEPIVQLCEVFNTAAEQNVYIPCVCENSFTEFEELANGYNAMIERLNDQHQALDNTYHQVKSKEEALRHQNSVLKLERDRTNFLVTRDQVSGVYSRFHFEKLASEALDSRRPGAVILIDLDGFKNINDSFSHAFGDQCLVHLGRKLSDDALGFKCVARVGGDEFLILMHGLKPEVEKSAGAIHALLQKPFVIQDVSVLLTGSIGITLFPQDGDNIAALYKNADLAMYKAKGWGKNQFCFYDPTMSEQMQSHMEIMSLLRTAHETGDVFIVYQPQVSPATGRTVSFEALTRLRSDKFGFISPYEFIPLAESCGLIVTLGAWVLENACIYAKQLLDEGYDFDYVAVNVSQVQLQQDSFVEMITGTLERIGLPPSRLQLEVTESVMADSTQHMITQLKLLKLSGVRVALDDFGTGYSSLNYLLKLPIDTLKIDKSFVDNMLVEQRTRQVCRIIIELGHTMGLKVVAEGVEDREQLEMLTKMGCDYVQGYVYSRPLDKESAVAHMSNQKLH